jgi:predicted Zn-dependent peptidase
VTTRGPLRIPRLTLSFLVSPGDAGAARETANREIHRLAARPPSADELDRARGAIGEEWADALRRAGRLACDAALAAVYPEQHPDELGRRLAALRAIGPRHLQRAVARFDTPDRRIEVTVLPRRRAEPARE